MRTRRFAIALVVTLLAGVVGPAVAEKGTQRVQFGLVYELATDDLVDMGQTVEVEDDFGFQVSYEYLLTDLIGIEPAFAFVPHDVEVEFGSSEETLGDIDFRALTANLNFHVLRRESIDLFVGPTVGYTFWGDFKGSFLPGDFGVEDDFIYGANVGIDVPLGSGKWSFTAALTYLVIDVELEDSTEPDLPFDPLQVKVGASVHF